MNVQSLVFFLVLSFLMVGCDNKTEETYSEILKIIKTNNVNLEDNIQFIIMNMQENVKLKTNYKRLTKSAMDIEKMTTEIITLIDHTNRQLHEQNLVQSKGKEIKEKIVKTKNTISGILDSLSKNKTFGINEYELQELIAKFAIKNEPIITNHTTLVILKNNILLFANQTITYLLGKIPNRIFICGRYEPVSSPLKNYIIKGETFETDIYLDASYCDTKITVKVNGKELPVEEGIARFKTIPKRYGEHSYTAEVSVHNRFTDKTETLKKTFKYEVGERCY